MLVNKNDEVAGYHDDDDDDDEVSRTKWKGRNTDE